MAFAVMCGVIACYLAWMMGVYTEDMALKQFFGEDALSEPAVYRSIPKVLFKRIQHLAAAPYGPDKCLDFGVTPAGAEVASEFVIWKDPYFVYALGIILPFAFSAST